MLAPALSLLDLPPDPSTTWADAYHLWLTSHPAANTRRAYRRAWEALLAFAPKAPWEIGKADLLAWIEAMRAAGLAPETIHLRLAAVSSFYTYVTRTYTCLDPQGREQPLHHYNPASAVPHPKIVPYGKAQYLSIEQARAFLRAIPRHTLQGKRDYALFLAYLATGRRNSEIRSLRWGDLEPMGLIPSASPRKARRGGPACPTSTKVYYRWSGKGKSRRDECPLPVYQAILDYLQTTGRLAAIAPDDYIFIPHSDSASHLPNNRPSQIRSIRSPNSLSNPLSAQPPVSSSPDSFDPEYPFPPVHPAVPLQPPLSAQIRSIRSPNPLSARMISSLVKKYARRAGLDPRRITVHTLRHTAAMLRKQAGDDLSTISDFLGHSTLAITQIYLHQIEGQPDASWIKVCDLLGV